MRVSFATRNYVASQIGTIDRALLNIAQLWLRHLPVAGFNFQWHTGTSEGDLPRWFLTSFPCEYPRIKPGQVEVPRVPQRNLVEYLFTIKKLGNRERRIFAERKVKARDIETGEVHAVVDAVVIGIIFERSVVPRLELTA